MRAVILAVTMSAISMGAVLADGGQPVAAPGEWVALSGADDLAGWIPVNCGPTTFVARDGMIVTTGVPISLLRSDRQYENFELELEWRHLREGGNAGVFLWGHPVTAPGTPFARGIEVQILDHGYNADGKNEWYTTHGDIFPIHGATMTPAGRVALSGCRSFPAEERSKGSPEWNHYRIVANDGEVRLSVNGKEVTVGQDCNPRKGYICLEAEGSECHFRNIRIRELPSTNPEPDEVAPLAEGFEPLYTGVDLSGWRQDPGHVGHWAPQGWVLNYDGKSEAADPTLWTEKEYADFQLICDWRWTAEPKPTPRPVILPDGTEQVGEDGQPVTVEAPDAGDSGIYLRGSSRSQVNLWCWPVGSGEVYGYRTDPAMPPEVRAGVTPRVAADHPIGEWNRIIVTMRGERLTVELNGQTVIENALLPGVPASGPIGLQHHGDPIQFASILVRELPEE